MISTGLLSLFLKPPLSYIPFHVSYTLIVQCTHPGRDSSELLHCSYYSISFGLHTQVSSAHSLAEIQQSFSYHVQALQELLHPSNSGCALFEACTVEQQTLVASAEADTAEQPLEVMERGMPKHTMVSETAASTAAECTPAEQQQAAVDGVTTSNSGGGDSNNCGIASVSARSSSSSSNSSNNRASNGARSRGGSSACKLGDKGSSTKAVSASAAATVVAKHKHSALQPQLEARQSPRQGQVVQRTRPSSRGGVIGRKVREQEERG
eukprot:1156295-Pelagomonas_calceolata.AAC.12